ncbi:MAG TPA: hypothetical protein DC060_13525, partial [Gemmatimonadetes bacterium]|nr:hypothetical protein [Gemmatimonadota bacterium]
MRTPVRIFPLVASLVLLAGPAAAQDLGPTGPVPYDIIAR